MVKLIAVDEIKDGERLEQVYKFSKEFPENENDFHNPFFGLDYSDFLEKIKLLERQRRGEALEEGKVPHTVFVGFSEQNKPVGMVKLRHEYTQYLREYGGLVGYAVAPAERGMGYATAMLKAILPEAKKVGLSEVLITAFPDNLPSRRVAEKAGFVHLADKDTQDTVYYLRKL